MKVRVVKDPSIFELSYLLSEHTCEVVSTQNGYYIVANNSSMKEDGDPDLIPVAFLDCNVIIESSDDRDGEFDLPEVLAGIYLTLDENPGVDSPTTDEFFDLVNFPKTDRSDFAMSAIWENTRILLENIQK